MTSLGTMHRGSFAVFYPKGRMIMKKICILGSTGSIGRQSIEVCKALRFRL